MADKFIIGADLDTSLVEKKLSDLEKKIKRMRETGPTGSLAQLSNKYRDDGDNQKAARLEQVRQRAQQQSRISMLRDLKQQESILDKLVLKEQALQNLMDKKLVGGRTMEATLKRQLEITNQIAMQSSAIMKTSNSLFPGGQTDGIPRGFSSAMNQYTKQQGGGGFSGMFKKAKNPFALAGMGLALAGTAIQSGGEVAYQMGTREERRLGHESDVSGMLSEVSNLQANRRGYELNLYKSERLKSLEMMMNRKKYSEMRDVTGGLGGAAKTIGASMAAGATVGGTAAMFGGPFTALGGAAVGAVVGGLAGTAKAGYNALSNDTTREGIGSMLGFKDSEDFYEKIKSGEASKVYRSSLEKEKSKNFEKTAAARYLEKNSGLIQGIQRGFGMSDEDLFSGDESLFTRGTRAGFTTDTISGQMNKISGAGGTTQATRGGGIMAAQMERGLNLTNAGSLLGKISGATGQDAISSKDELIRMYSEAMRIGLDASDFAKETRTFLDTAADMASSSGADSQNISNLLGMGVGTMSDRGIQASKSALENIKQKSGSMGGLTGQYQLASLSGKDMSGFLGKGNEFNTEELAMLSGMDITKISEKDEYMQTLMRRKGIEGDRQKDFVNKIKKSKIESTLRTPEQKKALEDYNKLKNTSTASPQQLADARSRIRELGVTVEGESESRRGVLEQQASANLMSGIMGGTGGGDVGKAAGLFSQKMFSETGKITDELEQAKSKDDFGQLSNLKTYSGQLSESFKQTTETTSKLRIAMDALITAMTSGNVELAKSYEQKIKGYYNNSSNQTNYVESRDGNDMFNINQVFGRGND